MDLNDLKGILEIRLKDKWKEKKDGETNLRGTLHFTWNRCFDAGTSRKIKSAVQLWKMHSIASRMRPDGISIVFRLAVTSSSCIVRCVYVPRDYVICVPAVRTSRLHFVADVETNLHLNRDTINPWIRVVRRRRRTGELFRFASDDSEKRSQMHDTQTLPLAASISRIAENVSRRKIARELIAES